MSHQCTGECQETKDCPLCEHGKDEETFCEECGDEDEGGVFFTSKRT